jgi:hypothetical protein
MLQSPRTVRDISCSSILVAQVRPIAFANLGVEKSGVESRALRNTSRPWTSFRLRWTLWFVRVCLRCKSRIAAPIALAAHRTAPEVRAKLAGTGSISLWLCAGLALSFVPQTAIAACSPTGPTLTPGVTVDCTNNPAGAQTTRLGQGPGPPAADNINVIVDDGASIIVTDTNAISLGSGTLGTNSTITL